MTTLLNYEYHYPLTPIQSESHNVHPAFRNDPELAFLADANASNTSLVPPPRNPLRTAVKPLFSTSVQETNISSPSIAAVYDDVSSGTVDCDDSVPASAVFPESPRSPSALLNHVPKSASFPDNEQFDQAKVGLERSRPSSKYSTVSKQQARSISTLTAPTLSTLPCPSLLLPQEWSLFLRDLQSAAALSKGQKGLAIAFALAVPIWSPIFKCLIGRAVWQYQTAKNVRLGLEDGAAFEQKRGREGVEAVLGRWNELWEERGVRIDLDIGKSDKKFIKAEKERFVLVVSDFEAYVPIDEGYASEDESRK